MMDAPLKKPELRVTPLARDTLHERAYRRICDLILDGEIAPSTVLPLTWVVAPADDLSAALRFRGGDAMAPLALTRTEGRRAEAEGRRAEAEGRRAETDARRAAEARVAELEAELKRRS